MSALGFVGGLAGAIAVGIYGLIAFVFFTASTLEQAERGTSSRLAFWLAAMGAIFWPLSLLVASLAAVYASRQSRQRRQANATRARTPSEPALQQPWHDAESGNVRRHPARKPPAQGGRGLPPPVLATRSGGRPEGTASPPLPEAGDEPASPATPLNGPAADAAQPPDQDPDERPDRVPEFRCGTGSASAPRNPPESAADERAAPHLRKAATPDGFLSACAHHLAVPSAIGGAIVRSLAPLQMQPQAPFARSAQERSPDGRSRLILSPRQYQGPVSGDGRHSDPKPSGRKPGARDGKSPRKGKQG